MEHRSWGTTGVSSSKMPQPMTRINGLPAHTKGYCKYPTYKTPWWTRPACSAAMKQRCHKSVPAGPALARRLVASGWDTHDTPPASSALAVPAHMGSPRCCTPWPRLHWRGGPARCRRQQSLGGISPALQPTQPACRLLPRRTQCCRDGARAATPCTWAGGRVDLRGGSHGMEATTACMHASLGCADAHNMVPTGCDKVTHTTPADVLCCCHVAQQSSTARSSPRAHTRHTPHFLTHHHHHDSAWQCAGAATPPSSSRPQQRRWGRRGVYARGTNSSRPSRQKHPGGPPLPLPPPRQC